MWQGRMSRFVLRYAGYVTAPTMRCGTGAPVRTLNAVTCLNHQAALSVAYGAGGLLACEECTCQ